MDSRLVLLLVTLAISFYGVGLIWMIQLIVFPSWRLLKDAEQLQIVRAAYWKLIPYFVFIPVGILFLLTIALIFYHPVTTPVFLILICLGLQLLSHILTGIFWARWEVQITRERHRPDSPLLARLINTHWIRATLVTLNALLLLWATAVTLGYFYP